jgi:hypothetical protein
MLPPVFVGQMNECDLNLFQEERHKRDDEAHDRAAWIMVRSAARVGQGEGASAAQRRAGAAAAGTAVGSEGRNLRLPGQSLLTNSGIEKTSQSSDEFAPPRRLYGLRAQKKKRGAMMLRNKVTGGNRGIGRALVNEGHPKEREQAI